MYMNESEALSENKAPRSKLQGIQAKAKKAKFLKA